MEKQLNHILENNKSFESIHKKHHKLLKNLAIPNIYSCNSQSKQPNTINLNCNSEHECIDDTLVNKLINLASYSEKSSKKTRKKNKKSKNNLKKRTKKNN